MLYIFVKFALKTYNFSNIVTKTLHFVKLLQKRYIFCKLVTKALQTEKLKNNIFLSIIREKKGIFFFTKNANFAKFVFNE